MNPGMAHKMRSCETELAEGMIPGGGEATCVSEFEREPAKAEATPSAVVTSLKRHWASSQKPATPRATASQREGG